MIEAASLRKHFGRHRVLEGVNLQVAQGERVALLGLNGAGKTTLIRCLLGLISFEGRLTVADCDVRTAGRAARERIGYVPQRAPHFDGMLAEVVDFIIRLRRADPAEVGRRLESLGLPLERHGAKPVRTLSGGMLQKVLLAMAMGAEVPLLILDEPTANLDARARREFLRALGQVEADTTVLLASHRFADVEAVADRLLVLHSGQIVFDGKMSELRDRVGSATTLWISVPAGIRGDAEALLRSRANLGALRSNGKAIGVCLDQPARADAIVTLRKAGIPVDDFWIDAPSLHELLEGVLGIHDAGADPTVEQERV